MSVPVTVLAWKAKEVLAERSQLNKVEAAVAAAGGPVQRAWSGVPEWNRSSLLIEELATVLRLEHVDIDQMFNDAAAIRS